MSNYSKIIFLNFIFFLFLQITTDAQTLKFYSSDRDLTNSMITKIMQDKRGFIWIATEDGLNRYDGLKFKSFKSSQNDTTSLTSNFVRTLFTDSKGRIWIGSINNLLLYNPDNESFQVVKLFQNTNQVFPHVTSIIETSSGDLLIATSGPGVIRVKKGEQIGYVDNSINEKLSSTYLECIYEDLHGMLWIGSENEGINLYNPLTKKNLIFQQNPNNQNSISSSYITSIIEDTEANVFIGTLNGGLNIYNRNKKSFSVIPTSPLEKYTLPIKSLYLDSKKNLWIGTDGMGLWKYNKDNNYIEPREIQFSRFEVHKTKIQSIIEDSESNLWLGIFQKGVLMIPERPNRFNIISYQRYGEYSIGSGCIMAINEDRQGNIWVGSENEGIYKISKENKDVSKIIPENLKYGSHAITVTSIYNEKNGIIWMGTSIQGLLKYDSKKKIILHYKHQPENKNSLSNDKVQCLTMDLNGKLWIGTSGGGLNKFDPETGVFTRFQNYGGASEEAICNNWVNTVYCDRLNQIWVGTYKGLSVYNQEKNTYKELMAENNLIPNNIVFSITEDKKGNIWIGTNDGLAYYEPKNDNSTFYTTKDGLSNNVICAVLEDNNENLWISTHNGISYYSKTDKTFSNYYVYDGLQGNEFRRNSALKSQSGELYFGGVNGITWFKPEQILNSAVIPDLYLTDLILYNKSVQIGEKISGNVILETTLEKTEQIKLSWQEKSFSIEFSIIGFVNPERIEYEYRLVGFDDGWIRTQSNNRRATYTNISPGKYIFEVRATNRDVVSESKQLIIQIIPPWWAAWWFRLIYIVFASAILFFVYMYIRARIKNKNEFIRHEQQERINSAKLQFFTNISHEIRTPLTLITGPLDEIISKNNDKSLEKSYRMIKHNTQRLIRLVNQLLDIRKIDSGQMQVNYSEINLVEFIEEIMEAFKYLSDKKQIAFVFKYEIEQLNIWIDPNHLDKVLFNVIANAFKFTPEKGEIEITFRIEDKNPADLQGEKLVEILISDTGIGIEEDKMGFIFDRFFQIENKNKINHGTGIGLHLSRTLMEMQHGSISAKNRIDRSGAVFSIKFPIGKSHLKFTKEQSATTLNEKTQRHENVAEIFDNDEEILDFENKGQKARTNTTYKIMIVDDDKQLREYLKSSLKRNFKIIECSDGKDAMEKIHSENPDLVLSDILMPLLDGINLCKKIKSNPATIHIPVVLLTGQNEDQIKAQGLETGADAYFVKPFNIKLLEKNIFNLLENRERVKLKYSKGGNVTVDKTPFDSSDDVLLKKVMAVITERLSDPNLNAETLSSSVGMSRVHLYRKLKKMTGQSPSDFIRNIRLQKAAYLLSGNKGFVKEIAFQVGFNSLSHFSHCFRNNYGLTPTEYAEKKSVENLIK